MTTDTRNASKGSTRALGGDPAAQRERSIDVEVAITRIISGLCEWGSLEVETTPNVPHRHPDTRVSLEVDGCEVWARGKGMGPYSLASGLYEVFEHAVAAGYLRKQPSTVVAELSSIDSDHLAKDGLLKYFVKTHDMAGGGTFDAVEFQTWPPDDEPKVYPARIVEPGTTYAQTEVYDLFRTSSGFAAGSTVAEATLHALNEVIERDALSSFLVSQLSGVPTSRRAETPPSLSWLYESVASTPGVGAEPHVHILPCLAGTVAVAECGLTDAHGRLDLGCGASLDPAYAVERALLELAQERIASMDGASSSLDSIDGPLTRLEEYPQLHRLATAPDFPDEKITSIESAVHSWSVEDALASLCQTITSAGFNVLWREIPTLVRGAHVVQVRVPGAEAFHLVRGGIPMEPMGRLRTREVVRLCRQHA